MNPPPMNQDAPGRTRTSITALAAVCIALYVTGPSYLGPRTANAELVIGITDGDQYWGTSPLLVYKVTVASLNVGTRSVIVSEQVPFYTTFEAAESTPGWMCSGADEGAACTLALGDLAPNEVRDQLRFAVRVKVGTPPGWDIYDDAIARSSESAIQTRAAATPAVSDDDCSEYRDADSRCDSNADAIDCCIMRRLCRIDQLTCLCRDGCRQEDETCRLPIRTAAATRAESSPAQLDPLLFYRVRDLIFRPLVGGSRATALYYRHTGEIAGLIVQDDVLRGLAKDALFAWQPGLTALDEGTPAAVSAPQVQALTAFLDALRPKASRKLAGAIDRGRSRLQVESWAGVTMTEALTRLDRLVCTRAATGASVLCRIDDVGEVLESDAPAGKFGDKLVAALARARSAAVAADQAPAGRKRRAGYKKTAKLLGKVARSVRSRKGRKAITDTTARARITEPIGLIAADLKKLGKT